MPSHARLSRVAVRQGEELRHSRLTDIAKLNNKRSPSGATGGLRSGEVVGWRPAGGTAERAVVVTIIVAVEAFVPFRVKEEGEIEQVALEGAPAQLSATV